MIEAFGLTSNPRKELPPAVDDVSFEARAGRVTALLGASGAGKSTALRLMLELQRGRGLTHFRGRPLHRIAHPRERSAYCWETCRGTRPARFAAICACSAPRPEFRSGEPTKSSSRSAS